MNNQFSIELGPEHDRRCLSINLPLEKQKIGVLVSGGLDSAILYFLLYSINKNMGHIHDLVPYTVERAEGSIEYAPKVINYMRSFFNDDNIKLNKIDIPSIRPHLEITIAVINIIQRKILNSLYIGVIQTRDEHAIGIDIIKPNTKSNFLNYPFYNLEKSHIIDLIIQLRQTHLFDITISCDKGLNCKICNGCRERAWGLEQMNVKIQDNHF